MLTLLHIGSRLFELFSKEVRVKKQPGRPLIESKQEFLQFLYLEYHQHTLITL